MVSFLYSYLPFFCSVESSMLWLDKTNVHVRITNVHIFFVRVHQNKNEHNKTKQTKIYMQMLSISSDFSCAHTHTHTRTEDEGSRVKGRRISLSDINGNSLNWKPFNGTWISGKRGKMSAVVLLEWRTHEINWNRNKFPIFHEILILIGFSVCLCACLRMCCVLQNNKCVCVLLLCFCTCLFSI